MPAGPRSGDRPQGTGLRPSRTAQPTTKEHTVTSRLEPGEPAPAFSLTDDTGATVSLTDFAGRKVIVYFYPAAMTPGCTKQACDFTDSLSSLQAHGYDVLGISPDSPAKLAKFRERDGLTISLLSDPDKAVLQAYRPFGGEKLD